MCVGMCVCVRACEWLHGVGESGKIVPPTNNEPFFTPFLLFFLQSFSFSLLLYPEEGEWGKRTAGMDGGREEKKVWVGDGRNGERKWLTKLIVGYGM